MGKSKSKKAGAEGNQSSVLRGRAGFDSYYKNIFGDRWDALKAALLGETVHAEWRCGACEPYYLDPASVFAASQLPLKGAKTVLDLCAAPGGKTLVLSSRMDVDAVLVSNERSAARKQRLSQVCENCLPEEIRNRIKISCSNGAKWCTTQSGCYERILLDVPCSSERHVIQDERYLDEWSPSRIKSLAVEQWALLSSAYRLLSPGGYLLYSTCALNPSENDDLVERIYKKFDDFEFVFEHGVPSVPQDVSLFCSRAVFPVPEKTRLGYHILPDRHNGCGPIWFTMLRKKCSPSV